MNTNLNLFALNIYPQVTFMGKFAIADAKISEIWVCRKCKARNPRGAERCRKCFYTHLRPKRKDIRAKKAA
jgi:large subunit ribosomal protein L40e